MLLIHEPITASVIRDVEPEEQATLEAAFEEASYSVIRDPEIAIAIENGDQQILSAVVQEAIDNPTTYSDLTSMGRFSDSYIASQIGDGVNFQTIDQEFNNNNLYTEHSTLSGYMEQEYMKNGQIGGRGGGLDLVTANLKRMTVDSSYAQKAITNLKGFDTESCAKEEYTQNPGTIIVDQTHVNNNGLDFVWESDYTGMDNEPAHDLYHIESTTGPVDISKESYLLKDPITKKVTGFNVNYAITKIQYNYMRQGISPDMARMKAEELFTSSNSDIKNRYLVEYVKGFDSQDIVNKMQNDIGQTTLHYDVPSQLPGGNRIIGDITILYDQYKYQ